MNRAERRRAYQLIKKQLKEDAKARRRAQRKVEAIEHRAEALGLVLPKTGDILLRQ